MEVEETGLPLWGEVGIDLGLNHFAGKKLCACGERAVEEPDHPHTTPLA